MMNHRLLSEETIILDMDVSTREDVIHMISGHLFLLKRTENPAGLYRDIMKRESLVSTYASMETAIPHAFSKYADTPTLFFVRIRSDDLIWSNEHENVKLVFFLVAPEAEDLTQQRIYLSSVLGKIAEIISDRSSLELLKTTTVHEEIEDYLIKKLSISV